MPNPLGKPILFPIAIRSGFEFEHILAGTMSKNYYLESLREDLRLLPSRLVSKEPAIYERWNRIDAEAEFRSEIIIPIAALFGILSYRLGTEPGVHLFVAFLCSALGGVIITILSQLSRQRTREARRQLLDAMDIGLIESPTLREIDDGVVRFAGAGSEEVYRSKPE